MEEALDAVPNPIEPTVVASDHGAGWIRWNNDLHATRFRCTSNRFGVVSGVTDKRLALGMSQKTRRDGDLVLLAGRQLDVKRTSLAVDDRVNLRRESTT